MKLRLKLILAFLLLSVVPLAGVIVYSFINSQRAVRKALESEAQMTADEMGRRRQMDRLSQLPFRSFLGRKGPSPELQKDPVFAELMKSMMRRTCSLNRRSSSVALPANQKRRARNSETTLRQGPRNLLRLNRRW